MSSFETRGAVKALYKFRTGEAWWVMAIDALFYFFLYGGVKLYFHIFEIITKPLQGIISFLEMTQGQIFSSHQQLLDSQAETMQKFVIYFFIMTFLLLIYILLIWTLSRGMIWNKTFGKKNKPGFFLRLFGLNSLMLVLIVVVCALFLLIMTNILIFAVSSPLIFQIILTLLSSLLVLLGMLIYFMFTKKEGVLVSLKDAFSAGAKNAKSLLLPFLAIIVFFLFYLILPANSAARIIGFVIWIVFFAWLRYTLKFNLDKKVK
jgi:hypothetical protein